MAAPPPTTRRRQLVMLAIVFAIVVAALAGAYWLFLRPAYVVLVENARPGEAAAVVADLDKRGIDYRLTDGGRTISVPESQADAMRLAIAGLDVATTGQVGFELFNKSDMGLTSFAQKINYQRALQGELVRTIMQMDGVETARVHLALPERGLFRDDRTEPSAAVTVTLAAGQPFDPARVIGIQRLVAAAVPDLPAGRVAVLDARGRVISEQAALAEPVASADRPAALEMRVAVEQYHRARARSVIEDRMAGTRFALAVQALPFSGADERIDAADWIPGGDGPARNYRLRLTLVTTEPIDTTRRAMVRDAVAQLSPWDAARGDELLFGTGPVDPPAAIPIVTRQQPIAPPPPPALPFAPAAPVDWAPGLWWMAAVMAVVAALSVWRRRRADAPTLAPPEHEGFARMLRRQLALSSGTDHATR